MIASDGLDGAGTAVGAGTGVAVGLGVGVGVGGIGVAVGAIMLIATVAAVSLQVPFESRTFRVIVPD